MLSMLAALCPIAMMKTGLRDNRIGPLHVRFLYLVILLDPDELDRLHQAFLYREGRRAFVDYIVEKPPFFSFLLAKLTFFLGYDTLWTYRTPFIMTGIAVSVATYVLSRHFRRPRGLCIVKTGPPMKSRTYASLAFRSEEGETPPRCSAYSSFSK